MFLNFTDVKRGVHEAYCTTFVKLFDCLITRSGLKPRFLRVDLCSEVRLGLVTCWGRLGRWFLVCLRNSVRLVEFGSGGIQVEGLHICGAFSCKWLVSEMELFFPGFDEADYQFSYAVVCAG